MSTQADRLPLGLRVGDRWEVVGTLGRGGFSVVYEATTLEGGEPVAIKVLRAAADEADAGVHAALFAREVSLLARLHHPHIVRLLADGTLPDGTAFAVFERLSGPTLAERLRADGPLAPAAARDVALHLLDALAHAHARGVVHRDLKPGNVILEGPAEHPAAKILDFGVAACVRLSGRAAGAGDAGAGDGFHGTPAYMAPEQLGHEAPTPATDLYAWGLIVLEALTGARAVPGRSTTEIVRHQLSPTPVPVPAAIARTRLGQLLRRATDKNLQRRLQSATQARRELEGLTLADLDVARLRREVARGPADAALAVTPNVRGGATPEGAVEAGVAVDRWRRGRA